MSFQVVVFLVLLALAFDFMNGFHDAANSIATIVSTRVLRPQWAVVWAAFFNFLAFAIFGVAVAATVGKGIVDPGIVDHHVIFGGLVGAIAWNIITWYYGIPSSSSHALIGGLSGAAVAKGGVDTLIASGFLKTAAAIVLSPLLGFVLGISLTIAVAWICRRQTPRRIDRWFRRLQFISAAFYSLPLWVPFACYGAIAMGTLFGGWRIVKTMGQKITKLKPVDGFCAETSGAITLFLATALGVPVSTTHTITGAIVGVGSAQKLSAVRWGVAGRIVWAWIFTIPSSAFIAAIAWWLGQFFSETAVDQPVAAL